MTEQFLMSCDNGEKKNKNLATKNPLYSKCIGDYMVFYQTIGDCNYSELESIIKGLVEMIDKIRGPFIIDHTAYRDFVQFNCDMKIAQVLGTDSVSWLHWEEKKQKGETDYIREWILMFLPRINVPKLLKLPDRLQVC